MKYVVVRLHTRGPVEEQIDRQVPMLVRQQAAVCNLTRNQTASSLPRVPAFRNTRAFLVRFAPKWLRYQALNLTSAWRCQVKSRPCAAGDLRLRRDPQLRLRLGVDMFLSDNHCFSPRGRLLLLSSPKHSLRAHILLHPRH